MAARIGIELSPVSCRVIEIEGVAPRGDPARTRIRSFASIPRAELNTSHALLASLRGRHASVVVWTAHSSHRQVSVPNGSYERMHVDALQGAAPSGMGQTPVLSDIAPASAFVPGTHRRVVLLASAPRTEIAEALRPLKDAGIIVDAVLTPASALTSLARLRNGLAPAGALEAYWAIEETASTLALTCDGHLVSARTAPWGYLSEFPSRVSVQPRPREEITMRLAEDISACLTSVQAERRRLAQVCVCGGLAELRNMTLPLMEQLDVEVEPLDTLFGIDSSDLPGPDGEFQERSAAFRLAWAAAADDSPVLDFARERQRHERKALFRQVAVAAGVLVGLGMGWFLQRQWRPAAPARRVTEARQPLPTPAPILSQPSATSSTPPVISAPLAAPPRTFEPGTEVILPGAFSQARPAPSPSSAAGSPERKDTAPPQVASASSLAPGLATTPPPAPPIRRSVEPLPPLDQPTAVTPVLAAPTRPTASSNARTENPSPPAPARSASTGTEPFEPPRATERPARPAPAVAERPATPAAAPAAVSDSTSPLPFDAVLGTILYGPERKLAIVDGRIIQAGDDVRGATVVEITPTSVYLRDAQGRLRRLTAGGTGR